jgi:hypothetical protein
MEWVSLSTSSYWENYHRSADDIHTILQNFNINEESLFDDYIHVIMYGTENKMSE